MKAKHFYRALCILLVGLVSFFIVRALLIPKSFGEFGHYNAADLAVQRDRPVRHGGRASCAPCHKEEFEKVTKGVHKKVECENCHAPVVEHASNKKKTANMPTDKSATLCLRCHEQLAARPRKFPQIVLAAHLDEMEEEMSNEVCVQCHVPHAPKEDL